MPEFPRLGFNCPSCFSVLYIKDPDGYDGRAAPCPYCMVSILPPRVVPQSPFMLVSNPRPVVQALPPVPAPVEYEEEVPAETAPPASRTSRWKPFRVHDFVPNETLSPETVPS